MLGCGEGVVVVDERRSNEVRKKGSKNGAAGRGPTVCLQVGLFWGDECLIVASCVWITPWAR